MNLLRKFARTQLAREWPDEFAVPTCFCADSPDTSGINAAAVANANISKEALDWYKQQYADSAPQRAAASDIALKNADLQGQLSQRQLQSSQDQEARYKSTFQPIEDRVASDAQNYDTPARREAAAAAASADVNMQVGLQRDATARALARQGVTPNSGRSMALGSTLTLGAAKASAGAANTARRNVEAVGSARLMDAAGIGRGVFGNQGTTAQIGLNAGNSSVANGQVPLNVVNQGASLMGQGFQTGIQGNASAGSLYGTAGQLQAGVDSANSSSAAGLASAAGMAIAI